MFRALRRLMKKPDSVAEGNAFLRGYQTGYAMGLAAGELAGRLGGLNDLEAHLAGRGADLQEVTEAELALVRMRTVQ